jgi:hypothetical protein
LQLSRLAVIAVDADGEADEVVIDVANLLYCCLGRSARAGAIDAPWVRAVRLRPDWVYVRTAQHLYRTHFRAVCALLERLPQGFVEANQGVAVNVNKIECPELGRNQLRRVGVRVAGRPGERAIEWVRVSRRHLRDLRYRLGLPLRLPAVQPDVAAQ